MNWLSLIAGVVSLVNALVGYLQDKKKIDGALAEKLVMHLTQVNKEILDAQTIRDSVAKRTTDELRASSDGLWRDEAAGGDVLSDRKTDPPKS